jgi:hypothetical protein
MINRETPTKQDNAVACNGRQQQQCREDELLRVIPEETFGRSPVFCVAINHCGQFSAILGVIMSPSYYALAACVLATPKLGGIVRIEY